MLNREFRKYLTERDIEQFKAIFTQEFSDDDYSLFLRKFRGSMIYRGKSSLSHKYVNKIWFILKKYMREQKYRQDTELAFQKAIFNLIPILSVSNIKRGRRVQVLPVLLKPHRRIVLINKWLINNQKNKSNVRGINIQDIARIILLTLKKKGIAYDLKMENQKRAFDARYMLLRPRDEEMDSGFNDFQKHLLRKLKERYFIEEKEKVITDVDHMEKLLSAFLFLKIKSKSRFFKQHKRKLRKLLFKSWTLPASERIYILMDWLNKNTKGLKEKRFYLNKTILNEFLKKYYSLWKKKKGLIW